MMINEFGQPIGEAVSYDSEATMPQFEKLEGKTVIVEPINAKKHLDDIFEFYAQTIDPKDWTYLYQEPFTSRKAVEELLKDYEVSQNPYFMAIKEKATGKVLGTFSLMRIDTKNRSAEMGRVIYAPALRKTRMATEAQYLVMRYVFETLNYRRYEWKCDSLNEPSRQAALRLGFQYEGCFRKAAIYKGRTRDTDWFSITDDDWKVCKKAFEAWLSDDNFKEGKQLKSLADYRQQALKEEDKK